MSTTELNYYNGGNSAVYDVTNPNSIQELVETLFNYIQSAYEIKREHKLKFDRIAKSHMVAQAEYALELVKQCED